MRAGVGVDWFSNSAELMTIGVGHLDVMPFIMPECQPIMPPQ